jgi:hypothetical protein
MLIESLESRELMSITPAAPAPLPIPYPNAPDSDAVAEKKKQPAPKPTLSDIPIVHVYDKASPKLFL